VIANSGNWSYLTRLFPSVQVAAAAVPAVGVLDGTGVAEAEGATGWLLAVPDEFDGVAEGLGSIDGQG